MTSPVLDYVSPTTPRARNRFGWLAMAADQLGLIIVLALLVAGFGLTTPYFFGKDTFAAIANDIPATALIAVGMTYVLVIGGIDLSVGSMLGLSGVVVGELMKQHHASPAVAFAAGLGVGLACGAVNGLVTVIWSIPSFIVTLGMLEIARGLAFHMSASKTLYLGSTVEGLADTTFIGLAMPFWIAIVVVLVGQAILSRTIFGRYMIAIGTNEEAVRLSGIATKPVKVAVFMIAGALSAAGAIVDVSHHQVANPNAGYGLELDVIAAVVIGGTSLMGGRGSVISSLLGVIIIAVLGAGLAQRGVPDEDKRIITGCVIVLAVILDYYRHRFSQRRA